MPNYNTLICIPAFNEARNISSVIAAAKKYGQVIVYDDGSSDDTAYVAEGAGAIVIRGATNKGYGMAIRSLLEAARDRNPDVMVTIDADGQHDPEQIPAVIEPILHGECDIVIGSRFLTEEDRRRVPSYRSFGIKTITKVVQMASYNELTDAQSGFRAYSRKALSRIQVNDEGMAVSTEILISARQSDLRIKEVPVTIRYDVEDASTHNPVSHGTSVLLNVIGFISIKHPLKFYGLSGLAIFAIGIAFAAWTLDIRAASGIWSTNTILISVGATAIGIALLLCGMVLYSISMMLRGTRRTV